MERLYQYPAVTDAELFVDPVPPEPEDVTQDKWHPRPQEPMSHWRTAAAFSLAALVAGAVMPIHPSYSATSPGGTEDHFAATSYVQASIERTQYQRWAGNIDPITEAEEITSDKWGPLLHVPIFDVERNQFLYPSSFQEDKQIHQEIEPPAGLFPATNQPPDDLARQQYTYPTHFREDATIHKEAPDMDSWYRPTETPPNDHKRHEYTYPSRAAYEDAEANFEEITPDKWSPDLPPLPKVRDRIFMQYGMAFRGGQEIIIVSKWYVPIVQPLFDVPRNQHTYPTFFMDMEALNDPERTQHDKWDPQYPDIVFDLERNQYLYPSFFSESKQEIQEAEPLESWLPETNEPLFDFDRRAHLAPTINPFYFDPSIYEIITLDKWFRPTNTPPDGHAPTYYTYPYLFWHSVTPATTQRAKLEPMGVIRRW